MPEIEIQLDSHTLVVRETPINMSSEVTVIRNQILDYMTAYLIPIRNFHYIFNILYLPVLRAHQRISFPFRLIMSEGWPHSGLRLRGMSSCF